MKGNEDYKEVLKQEEIFYDALKKAKAEDTDNAWMRQNTERNILGKMLDNFGREDYIRIKIISNIIK